MAGRFRHVWARLAVSTLLAPLLPLALSVPVHAAAGPAVEVLSHGSWRESFGAAEAIHIFGRFHNKGTTNATAVQTDYKLFNGTGTEIGHSRAVAEANILAPDEISPFDDVVFFPAGVYSSNSITDSSLASASLSVNQPYHNPTNLTVAVTPCSPAGSDACQNHIAGTVTNAGPVVADNIRVIFTVLNGAGAMVGQDVATVFKADGTTALKTTENGSFSLDRTGEPAWSGDTSSAGLVVLAEPSYPVDLNPSKLDFGDQRKGTASPPLQVTITNNGAAAVTIGSTTGSPDFAPGTTCATVAAGKSCTMTVVFTPSVVDNESGTLTIADDAAGTPQIIPLTGRGVAPSALLVPSSWDFGHVQVKTASPPTKAITLTNTGTGPMAITGIAVSGTNAADFAESHPTCGSSLAANGGNCAINVTFTPGAGGQRNANLVVTDDAGTGSQTVPLTGFGDGPAATFDKASLDFGPRAVGSTTTLPLTLTNTGNQQLTNINITLSAGAFALVTSPKPCGTTLDANASCEIDVSFSPTQPRQENATLTVTDNAGDSPQHVPVTGTGTAPAVGLNPASLAFGSQPVGQASPQKTVIVTDTGNAPLVISTVTSDNTDYVRNTNCEGKTLQPNDTCSIGVTFQPSSAGPSNGKITITDNAAPGTQTITLTGTGANNQWEFFGGILSSGPVASSSSSDRMDVFVQGQDNGLWQRTFTAANGWGPWTPLGGIITVRPGAVSSNPNQIDVFARGQDRALWQRTFTTANGWGPWTPLGGILDSAPGVSSWGAGRLDVFVRGQDRQLWHRSFDGIQWNAWEPLGGILLNNPTAVSSGTNQIDVFIRGQDHQLWQRSFNGSWGPWTPLGGIIASGPGAASSGSGVIDVFAQGQDNQLWQRTFTAANGWGPWTPLSGILTTDPGAVSRVPGSVEVFVRGQDRALWHKTVSG